MLLKSKDFELLLKNYRALSISDSQDEYVQEVLKQNRAGIKEALNAVEKREVVDFLSYLSDEIAELDEKQVKASTLNAETMKRISELRYFEGVLLQLCGEIELDREKYIEELLNDASITIEQKVELCEMVVSNQDTLILNGEAFRIADEFLLRHYAKPLVSRIEAEKARFNEILSGDDEDAKAKLTVEMLETGRRSYHDNALWERFENIMRSHLELVEESKRIEISNRLDKASQITFPLSSQEQGVEVSGDQEPQVEAVAQSSDNPNPHKDASEQKFATAARPKLNNGRRPQTRKPMEQRYKKEEVCVVREKDLEVNGDQKPQEQPVDKRSHRASMYVDQKEMQRMLAAHGAAAAAAMATMRRSGASSSLRSVGAGAAASTDDLSGVERVNLGLVRANDSNATLKR